MRRQTELLENVVETRATRAAPAIVHQVEPVGPAKIESLTESPERTPVKWDRVTIRLTEGELTRINDVVIATQQASRDAKITMTDVLRTALMRFKEDVILPAEIHTLRAQDARMSERHKVRQ